MPKSQGSAKKAVKPKIVEIRVSRDGRCSPDPARVYSIDSVRWTGDVIDLHFPDSNPFDNSRYKEFKPNVAYKVSKLQGNFKYNVHTSTGTYDPNIIVEPPPRGQDPGPSITGED